MLSHAGISSPMAILLISHGAVQLCNSCFHALEEWAASRLFTVLV